MVRCPGNWRICRAAQARHDARSRDRRAVVIRVDVLRSVLGLLLARPRLVGNRPSRTDPPRASSRLRAWVRPSMLFRPPAMGASHTPCRFGWPSGVRGGVNVFDLRGSAGMERHRRRGATGHLTRRPLLRAAGERAQRHRSSKRDRDSSSISEAEHPWPVLDS